MIEQRRNGTSRALAPVVVAVSLALGVTIARAAPAPGQMPGAGLVTNVSTGATVNTGGSGSAIVNLNAGATITLGGVVNGRAVIQWGGAGTAGLGELTNPAGFNIGDAGKLSFNNVGGGVAAILNIDASGNPSQIYGALVGVATSLFVANGNGIIVGPKGHIASPNVIGLIGADLDNPVARNEFVRNNNVSIGESFIDVTVGQSTVTIQSGALLDGDLAQKVPASNILLLGGDIVNAGSLHGAAVNAFPGMRAAPLIGVVNGKSETVNRLWNVDTDAFVPQERVGIVDSPDVMEVASAGGFVNNGAVTAGVSGIRILAGGNIRSGSAGDQDVAIGLYTDGGVSMGTFGIAGTIALYNVIAAATPGAVMEFFNANGYGGSAGDVTIDALTPAGQPSSLTTKESTIIQGSKVEIDSTINHQLLGAGVSQHLFIGGTEVAINAAIGSVEGIDIVSSTGNIAIHANVTGGNSVFINGNYSVALPTPGTINIVGAIVAANNVSIDTSGILRVAGALTAGSRVDIGATHATTTLTPSAVITAPFVSLDVLNFRGVDEAGNAYASLAGKPAAQIVTNTLSVQVFGSMNAPIAGNTNWLDNAIVVAPLVATAPVTLHVTAVGRGFQAINLQAIGNAQVDSGNTVTPFIGVALGGNTQVADVAVPNGGSQLIVSATGNLDVVSGNNPTGAAVDAFQFPGGIVFKAGGALTVRAPIYNAWTAEALPYQGVFFEAPVLATPSYVATSGNTWGNWSTLPVSGTPTVYRITPTAPASFGLVNSPDAVHKNTYSALIKGGPVCFTSAPAAWSACP